MGNLNPKPVEIEYKDKTYRCTFTLPNEQRHEFARLLKQEIARVRAFMNENY